MEQEKIIVLVWIGTWILGALLIPWTARFNKNPISDRTLAMLALMWPAFGLLIFAELLVTAYWRIATGRK